MIDVLLLAELAWCTTWLRKRGLSANLFYAGGMLAAGYVAMNVSGWMASHFVPPTSSTALWLENHLTDDTQSVTALASLIPPISATTGLVHSQWIAFHLVKMFLFISVTAAIFVLFVVTHQFMIALWDRQNTNYHPHVVITTCLSLAGGIYLSILTIVLLANLTWLQGFSVMSDAMAHSVSVHAFTKTIHGIQGWMLP